MSMNIRSRKLVFKHIIDVYDQCSTIEDVYRMGLDEFICISVQCMMLSDRITKSCLKAIHDNQHLSYVNNDLVTQDSVCFWSVSKSIDEGRFEELLRLKINFLKKLIQVI